MSPIKLWSYLLTGIVPLSFGLLFLASGVSKCLRTTSVLHIVANYRLLPAPAGRVFAYLLGPLEALSGSLFLASLFLPVYPYAWAAAVGLLLLFSFAVGSALIRRLQIPCGCALMLNGHAIRPSSLLRNLLLLLVLAIDLFVKLHNSAA